MVTLQLPRSQLSVNLQSTHNYFVVNSQLLCSEFTVTLQSADCDNVSQLTVTLQSTDCDCSQLIVTLWIQALFLLIWHIYCHKINIIYSKVYNNDKYEAIYQNIFVGIV